MKKALVLFLIFLCIVGYSQEAMPDSAHVYTDTVAKGTVKVNADYRVDELMERYKKENEGALISGYRVQLFSGRRKDAFDLKADFLAIFPNLQVTVVYDSPDFKTQAGNYRTKLEAEKALELIWPEFKSAFVVKTDIDLPPLEIEKESN